MALTLLKSVASDFLRRGCSDNLDEETNRRILVVNLFALVGITITLLLGLHALLVRDWHLGFSLLAASSLFFLSSQIQAVYRTQFGQLFSVYLLTGCLLFLETYLVITGGVNNTGPLWIYLVPPVAMFFGGVARGIAIMVCFILLIAIILLFPNDALLLTKYSYEFKTRLLYSLATVTFLSAFYEYSRQRTYDMVKSLSAKFEQQALHDPLTQLPNRRGIQQLLEQEVRRQNRHGRPLALMIVDLDNFKQVNDTYGHATGDMVLRRTADVFRKNIRRQDIVARWGGEEFLIVLPETPEANAAYLADKIRATLAKTQIWLDEKEIRVSASFGICEVNKNISVDRALTLADKALYYVKQHGRNQIKCAETHAD